MGSGEGQGRIMKDGQCPWLQHCEKFLQTKHLPFNVPAAAQTYGAETKPGLCFRNSGILKGYTTVPGIRALP